MPPDAASVLISYVSLITEDVDGLTAFYASVFGLKEVEGSRSHRYRELECGSLKIGVAQTDAYGLLNLADQAEPAGVRSLITFAAGGLDQLEALTDRALAHGARLARPPFDAGHGVMLSVLLDPAGNALRISAPVSR